MLEFITELKTRLKINGNILKTPNYSKFRKILVFYISSLIIDSITLQIIEHIYANIPISMYDSFPRGFDGFYINTIYMELKAGNSEIIKVYNSLIEPTAEQREIFETYKSNIEYSVQIILNIINEYTTYFENYKNTCGKEFRGHNPDVTDRAIIFSFSDSITAASLSTKNINDIYESIKMEYFHENIIFLKQHKIDVSSIKNLGESRDRDTVELRIQEYTKQEYFNSEKRILMYIKQEYIDSEQRILEYIKNPPIIPMEEIKKEEIKKLEKLEEDKTNIMIKYDNNVKYLNEENPIKETSIIYELY